MQLRLLDPRLYGVQKCLVVCGKKVFCHGCIIYLFKGKTQQSGRNCRVKSEIYNLEAADVDLKTLAP